MPQSDHTSVPELLDSPRNEAESHGTKSEKTQRTRRESLVPKTSPVDHVALYAALEELHFTFPTLLDGYRKSTLPPMLEHMLVLYGIREIKGPLTSETIGGWISELGGAAGPVQDDDAEWCCIPTALAAQRCGYPLPLHASWSRAWASWGAFVSAGDERLGDLVVLTRGLPSAGKGHVGLAVKWEPGWVSVLGGNTGDAVQVGWYERGERILAVRRPDPRWEEAVPWPGFGGLEAISDPISTS